MQDGLAQELARGKEARAVASRRALGDWMPATDRADPVALLASQDASREVDLVPIRHQRMAASAFSFFRGSAAIMAADLASVPHSSLTVQLSGDAHLSNLGLFASPERQLLFGLNDFDETLPGPFEWDVARLVASVAIAAEDLGLPVAKGAELAGTCAMTYRTAMADFARQGALETWYAKVLAEDLVELARKGGSKQRLKSTERTVAKARSRTSIQAVAKLTESEGGRLRFVHQPPLIVPVSDMAADMDPEQIREQLALAVEDYRSSISDSRALLLDHYDLVDVAHKVVGVGSVGLRAFIALLQDRMTGDPLVLQLKEARPSVLEAHLPASRYAHPGQRVVEGQHLLQAASDIFLGWSRGVDPSRSYYWRQLHDMKGSAAVETMDAKGLGAYARVCAWSLAKGHARSGSDVAISAYLGTKTTFDTAMADFARRYVVQNRADFDAHAQAITDGVLPEAP